jgi:uncharacterized protein (TIGR02145 family)
MKKLFILLISLIFLTACKKEANITNPSTKNSSDLVTCVDNSNINFTVIGTTVGKFGDCIKDIDGNIYKTVTIGTQTWIAENLKVSKYNDGTIIPNVSDNIMWSNLNSNAWCYYDNEDVNNHKYGKLYNWYTISKKTNGNKNVCPKGWHVPTNIEWTILTDYLGGDSIAGYKMKEVGTTNWESPNLQALNSSLFSAIPSGSRYYFGTFYALGNSCGWWSSSIYDTISENVWVRSLNHDDLSMRKYVDSKTNGLSIRCLKD